MENLGLVSNFIEIGQLLFGPDVKIRYEVKNDHEDKDPDTAQIIFYLERKIENITYSTEKEYTMFVTNYGIMLSSKDGDRYFEKYDFKVVDTWEDVVEDCPSFKS